MHLQVTNGIPIMKRLLNFQREDVERRLKHEQHLLCNAFRDRHLQRWDDFCVHGQVGRLNISCVDTEFATSQLAYVAL